MKMRIGNAIEKVNEENRVRGKYGSNIISYIILCIILSIILLPLVDAHFVCGEVRDSDDNMSAQWFNVRVFYEDSGYASCEISPAGNKYCCDVEAILGKSWNIGDRVFAEIFSNETGYVADKVSVVTSGEGYDVFPVMQLEKVVRVYNLSKLIFSNESKLILNASFKEPYNYIELEEGGNGNERKVLCEDCSSVLEEVNCSWGMNYYKLFASYGERIFSEDLVVAMLRWFDFNREIECKRCRGNRVRSRSIVNMSLNLSLSDSVEGLELREYVPVDWEIIDGNGIIRSYSESHKVIIWNVSGKNFVKKYIVKAPKVWFFPRKYIFRTELEGKVLGEDEVLVSRFFWFFGFDEEMRFRVIKKKVYSRIRPEKPLVIKPKNSEITRMAVFPNETFRNIEFSLMKHIPDEEFDGIVSSYLFDTNLEKEDIEKIYIEFKIEKEFMEDNNYENISLFVFDDVEDEDWEEVELGLREDSKYKYYNVSMDFVGGVVIVGVKEGFWNKLF